MDRFVVAGRVTHERLDDEVLAVHLGTGLYYSMVGVAADCWDSLVAGASAGEIVEAMGALPGADAAIVQRSVARFVVDVLAEGLVIGSTDVVAGTVTVTSAAFDEPALERHGDLQDLLLIDPIHDVSDEGWPAKLD